MTRRWIASLFALWALVAFAQPAAAKSKHDSPYSFEQTFGTALRLVKVDLDFEVNEVNSEWGYLLFTYTSTESGKRKNRASFTFVKDDEQRLVHVKLQIPSMPNYHEQLVLTKLKRKLESEHGEAPVAPEPDEDDEEEEEDEDPNAPIVPGQDDDDAKKKKKARRPGRRPAPPRRPARSPRRKGK